MCDIGTEYLANGNLFGVVVGKIGAHSQQAKQCHQNRQCCKKFQQTHCFAGRRQLLFVDVAQKSGAKWGLVNAELLHLIFSVGFENLLFVLFALADGFDEQIVREERLLWFGYDDADIQNALVTCSRRITREISHYAANVLGLNTTEIELTRENR